MGNINNHETSADTDAHQLGLTAQNTLSVMDFVGVVGDGVNDDSDGLQAAINATPWGGVLELTTPSKNYLITRELIVDKPITIRGNGGTATTSKAFPMIKVQGYVNAFKIRASLDGYLFGLYGISGVHIQDIMLEGPSLAVHAKCGICSDETINNGVFHIRGCTFTNVHIRYFDYGWNLRGIVYLNNWFACRALWCATGCRVDKVSGANEGASDQNRWYGCEFVLCDRGASVSEEGYSGSNSFFGCTLSEGLVGLIAGFNTTLYVAGGQIENNQYSGINIALPEGVSNPNSEAGKVIVGNCFILNNIDIWIDKKSTTLQGGFAFPVLISGNTFSQTKTKVLYIVAPTGPQEFDSRQFIFESSNCYSGIDGKIGPVPMNMIQEGWRGYNGYKEDGKVSLSARVTGNVYKNVMHISLPYGKQCYIKYRIVSIPDNAAAGTLRLPAGINFTNADTGVLIKNDFTREGELFISREDVGFGKEIIISLAANAAENVAIAEVDYCLI